MQLRGPGISPFNVSKQTLLLSYLQTSIWDKTNTITNRVTGTQEGYNVVNVTMVATFAPNATSLMFPKVGLQPSPAC